MLWGLLGETKTLPPRRPTPDEKAKLFNPWASCCSNYSQVAGFVEGASLVQRVRSLVSQGDLQVAGDVDLGRQGRAEGLGCHLP